MITTNSSHARVAEVSSRCGVASRLLRASLGVVMALTAVAAHAAAVLENIEFASLPGNQVEIDLIFSGSVSASNDFSTDNPPRIAIDFPGVKSNLEKRPMPIGLGVAHSLAAVEASDRTRVVVNLNEAVPYDVTTVGNRVTIALNPATEAPPPPAPRAAEAPAPPESRPSRPVTVQPRSVQRSPSPVRRGPRGTLKNIDFRRGADGEGRVIITLPSADTRVTVREEGRDVVVSIDNTELPQRLFRRLDVVDFATPVVAVESRAADSGVRVDVKTTDDYDYLAYQTDNLFTLEFRSLTPAEKEQLARDKVVYSGDRLSLNFQDIEVRAVLQLLADFTGLNLVASDTVRGNITLRLKNVPWDQALDIILKTKGLDMRQTGNVIMVAPAQEIIAAERLELQAQQDLEELAPLRSEFLQVNYATATEMRELIQSEDANLLTPDRGSISVDQRTNTLLVQDTAAKIEEIRTLVGRLDRPVRQVMIESRIVIANNDFARDLGVRFGLTTSMGSFRNNELMISGSQPGGVLGTQDVNAGPFMSTFPAPDGEYQGDNYTRFNSTIDVNGAQGLMVNLPVTGDPAGAINFLIGKAGSYLLQLELSAMQREGRGEIVSSPRLITSDQQQATIQVGQQIPYQESNQTSTTNTVSFKDAALTLDVTPHITPDDRIIMDLAVSKDNPDWTNTVNGNPAIDTRSVETKVLVDNGETVVLGGVYEREKSFSREQVPWLGDLPVVGNLFKRTARLDNNSELLIFVTPKILQGNLAER
jgi:type IV pilus assembly protein PilQ